MEEQRAYILEYHFLYFELYELKSTFQVSHFTTSADWSHWRRHVNKEHCDGVLGRFSPKVIGIHWRSTYTCSFRWHRGCWMREESEDATWILDHMMLVLFSRTLSQTVTDGDSYVASCSEHWAAFITRRIRDIVSRVDQAALQIPNVGAFVGQRHGPEHGPATNSTYSQAARYAWSPANDYGTHISSLDLSHEFY